MTQEKLTQNVALSETKFGIEHRGRGIKYPLANSFGPGSEMLGGDRLNQIFFRTRSDNLYYIDPYGNLVNKNESLRRGVLAYAELTDDLLVTATLTVGLPFIFGRGNTTELTEIVTSTSRAYNSDYVRSLTEGRFNPIMQDFLDGLPARTPSLNRGVMIPF